MGIWEDVTGVSGSDLQYSVGKKALISSFVIDKTKLTGISL